MTTRRQLHFAQPQLDAFLDVMRPLWAEGVKSTRMIGENALATALAKEARKQGSVVKRDLVSAARRARDTQLIVFTDTAGEALSTQLLSCVELENVVVLAPVTERHFSQKPLFLVSIPKAGTHLMYQLAETLGYRAGVELPDFPQGQTWYCVEYSNSHTVARDFFVDSVRRAPFGNRHHPFMHSPALFIYRHPLDILVSEAHYYHRDGKTPFSGYLSTHDFETRVGRLMRDTWLLGSLRDRIGGFLPWLEFPNVIPLSFEELVGAAGGGRQEDQLRLIWSIQLKLQAPGITDHIASRVFNSESATFREGQIGGYTAQLSSEVIKKFARDNSDLLGHFGYPVDGSPGRSSKADEHRHRPLHFSEVNYDDMPLTIESDFLGCNLVRYRRRAFAVPIAAGLVQLDKLPPETLADLPVADTLPELKSLLLTGKSDFTLHRQALDELAAALKHGTTTQAVHRYWGESATPHVFGEYRDFNLVASRGRYFGLRRSIGRVDLAGDIGDLAHRFGIGDVVISTTLSELRHDIDGLSTAGRIGARIETLQEHARTNEGALVDAVNRFDTALAAVAVEQQLLHQALGQLQQQVDAANARANDTDRLLRELLARFDPAQTAIAEER